MEPIHLTDRLRFEKHSDLPSSGKVATELHKDHPSIRFSRWSGEARFEVEYPNIAKEGRWSAVDERMEWKDTKEELHAYPLNPKAGMEDGGFEIEIVLNNKPTSNVFTFPISGAEDLDFFYQGELTPEEVAEGVSRPENVVGSYAVYHKVKRNHVLGEINYATGKAYHIYRPEAVDADGAKTWAVLAYSDGMLTVEVPQKFLKNAAYPVKVDPTFGYTTVGSSSIAGGSSSNSTVSQRWGTVFSAPESGTLNSLSSYVRTSNSQTLDTFAAVNQRDSGGTSIHGKLSTATATGVSYSATPQWYTINLGGESIVSGTNYILSVCHDGGQITPTDAITQYYDALADDRYTESFSGAGSFAASKEDPWTIAVNGTKRTYSIYATYTPSSAPTPLPTQGALVAGVAIARQFEINSY